jgi:hypothetical protein
MERVMCATKGFSHFSTHRRNGLMLLRTDKVFNALASNLDLNVLDKAETNEVYIVACGASWRHGDLEVDTVDQIAVTADLGGYATAESSGAIKCLLDGLNREVGVAAVDSYCRHKPLNFRKGMDYILRLSTRHC